MWRSRFPSIVVNEPTAWWHWPPYLVAVVLFILFLGLTAVLSVPYLAMFPEHAPHRYDRGTDQQRKIIERYRRRLAKTPALVRIAQGVVAVVKLPFMYLRYLFREVLNPWSWRT